MATITLKNMEKRPFQFEIPTEVMGEKHIQRLQLDTKTGNYVVKDGSYREYSEMTMLSGETKVLDASVLSVDPVSRAIKQGRLRILK